MEVSLYPMDSVRSFSFQIGLRAGSYIEPKGTNGTLHFLEHMLLNGCKKYPNTSDITAKSEELGLSYNAHVNHLETRLWFHGPETTFDETLSFVADLLLHPLFNKEKINNTKGIILAEYQDHWRKPESLYAKESDLFFYGSQNPYLPDSLGTPKTVNAMTADSLRDAYRKYYQTQHLKVCIAGKFDSERATEKLNVLFKPLSHGVGDLEYKKTKHKENRTDHVFIFDAPRSQVDFTICFPIPGYKETEMKGQMEERTASRLVGENRTSLLNTRIREELGLVYGIQASVSRWPYTGTATIYATCAVENIGKCLDAIKGVLQRVEEKGFDRIHFERAQKYANMQRYMYFSSPSAIADWLLGSMLEDESVYLPEDYEKVTKTISLEDANKKARDIFNRKNAVLTIMGDKKQIESNRVEEAFAKFRN